MAVRNGNVGRALAAICMTATIVVSTAAQGRRAAVARIVGAEPRAIVYVNDIRVGRADAGGSFTLTIPTAGTHTVLVRQPGFADSTHRVAFSPSRQASVRPKKVKLADPAEIARMRGEDLLADGKYADAVTQFQAAIEARKGVYPRAQVGLARAYFGMKRFEEAVTAATQVLEASPKDVEARTVLASSFRERGFYEEAAAEYRKAIVSGSGTAPEAHTGLAIVLEELGDTAAAVEELRVGIEQNLDAEPVLYHVLGAYLERLDKKQEAIQAYERFLELAPNHNLAPAVRSVLERLRVDDQGEEDEGDVNPYAPPGR